MTEQVASEDTAPSADVIRLPTFSITVADSIRLLQFKLGIGADGAPLGDAALNYTPWEAFDGLPPADPYDITFTDLTATVAMNSNVVARHVWVLAKLRRDSARGSAITSALRQIPTWADIRFPNAYVSPTAAILGVFLGEAAPGYIKTAILFKVLCRLRPGLFPMWDNVVQEYAAANALGLSFGSTYLSYGWQAIPWFRLLVLANWAQLQQVTARLAADGVPITELRALESLVWMFVTNPSLVFRNVTDPWPGASSPWLPAEPLALDMAPAAWPARPPGRAELTGPALPLTTPGEGGPG